MELNPTRLFQMTGVFCRLKVDSSLFAISQIKCCYFLCLSHQGKDVVELYDGISGMLITRLSGVYGRPISFTSQSNVMDIRFSSDADDSSVGFKAQYQEVCKQ